MNAADTDTRSLIDEVERYLAAVEAFRALGCEPTWQRECSPAATTVERILSGPQEHRAVH
jgi:hypothetical protein